MPLSMNDKKRFFRDNGFSSDRTIFDFTGKMLHVTTAENHRTVLKLSSLKLPSIVKNILLLQFCLHPTSNLSPLLSLSLTIRFIYSTPSRISSKTTSSTSYFVYLSLLLFRLYRFDETIIIDFSLCILSIILFLSRLCPLLLCFL